MCVAVTSPAALMSQYTLTTLRHRTNSPVQAACILPTQHAKYSEGGARGGERSFLFGVGAFMKQWLNLKHNRNNHTPADSCRLG